MNKTQIAEELGRDRKTIDKWLREEGPKSYQRQKSKPSILAPYQDYIHSRMEEGCLNAAVLFDEIKAKGYPGQIRLLRPNVSRRPLVNRRRSIGATSKSSGTVKLSGCMLLSWCSATPG
ncbi:hypothetical protein [Paenibacillus sp. sptzw28]|uniref:hypothetical protein n=1 Tax=Paenibacillus sp. sptzw28 TaxID=715179 RepID=UPI002162ACFD|nr:hypothetical protein [Paenibacillus sp. sptzw28]